MEVSGRVAGDEPSSAFAGLGQRELVSRMHEQLDELLAARDQMEHCCAYSSRSVPTSTSTRRCTESSARPGN